MPIGEQTVLDATGGKLEDVLGEGVVELAPETLGFCDTSIS